MGDQEREKDEWHNKMEMSEHKNVMMSSSRDIDQIKKSSSTFLTTWVVWVAFCTHNIKLNDPFQIHNKQTEVPKRSGEFVSGMKNW